MLPKVLIADDSLSVRNELRSILIRLGFRDILEAASPAEAIQLYSADKPRLVILDSSMPEPAGVSPLSVLRFIRASEPELPVFVAVSHFARDVRETYSQFGATAFIDKPIRRFVVYALLAEYLITPLVEQSTRLQSHH